MRTLRRVVLSVLLLLLLAGPANCVEVRVMSRTSLWYAEQILRIHGYQVATSDGLIVGNKKDIERGTATTYVRGCVQGRCWVLFEIWARKFRVVLIRPYPASAPERKINL